MKIHVIYIDQSSKIREQVRSVDDKTWKELPIPSGLPAPINTSKISSGICHDSGNGHHWIFFSRQVTYLDQVAKLINKQPSGRVGSRGRTPKRIEWRQLGRTKRFASGVRHVTIWHCHCNESHQPNHLHALSGLQQRYIQGRRWLREMG